MTPIGLGATSLQGENAKFETDREKERKATAGENRPLLQADGGALSLSSSDSNGGRRGTRSGMTELGFGSP